MPQSFTVQCCIAGGGPAGMMLGYLLGRAGVSTLVLEKHADFLRDFRGDTVHPSTMQIMQELDLLDDFLKRPHSRITAISAEFGRQTFRIADFADVPTPCRFIALMPQWDFLNFLLEKGRRFPSLRVLMQAQVTGLIRTEGRVSGVEVMTPDGPLRVNASLVVGCDGRTSTVRAAAALPVQNLAAPIDVLWFRLSKKSGDPQQVMGHLEPGSMVVTIDRTDYWQCAYVIAKGSAERVRAAGIDAFRRSVSRGAAFLADRVEELKSLDDVKLLTVTLDRLVTWSAPGLLCIGDAAHAMSPVGGVGINLAIQDAVAAANLLAAKLKTGAVTLDDLAKVQQRRKLPVMVIQRAQLTVHKRVLEPLMADTGHSLEVPWIVQLLDRYASLRRWPAQIVGIGIRPEHVRSPEELYA
jgi:2-polyprenyl-6-methoxyphenol hydroxylase-like FAD-dependent oxidoreductase